MRKVGIYVDASNISMNGGGKLRYEELRVFACRENGFPQRLNIYLPYDDHRARNDTEYYTKTNAYQSMLRDLGYRVSNKLVKRYTDDYGETTTKANTDLDMAVDAMTEAERLDSVLLVTGDGDFVKVVKYLQSKGCRVEVLAFDNISKELIDSADHFVNGYIIPNMVAQPKDSMVSQPKWGEVNSRVRGVCRQIDIDKGYGFFNYLADTPRSLITSNDYQQAYFKVSSLPERISPSRLPSRSIVFEFELSPPTKEGGEFEARRISLISSI